jgi:hypothetical protein
LAKGKLAGEQYKQAGSSCRPAWQRSRTIVDTFYAVPG